MKNFKAYPINRLLYPLLAIALGGCAASGPYSGPQSLNSPTRAPGSEATPFQKPLEIGIADYLNGLTPAERQGVKALLLDQIKRRAPESPARAEIETKLSALFESGDFSKIEKERFPSVKPKDFGVLAGLIGQIDPVLYPQKMRQKTKPVPQVLNGQFEELLNDGVSNPETCNETSLDFPAPMGLALRPTLARGHYPNPNLSLCEIAQSRRLAQILTSLAAQNGSEVELDGQKISSPRALFEALLLTGHEIRLLNERMYADFIGLADQVSGRAVSIRWPVWMDTGLKVNSKPLQIPSGHSQHAWIITGPIVKARVLFYLGISGAGFFAQTQERPSWSRARTQYFYSSATGNDETQTILKSMDVAAAYLRVLKREVAAKFPLMPADAYGMVGVCNDSTAVIEFITQKQPSYWRRITTYPIARNASLKDPKQKPLNTPEALRSFDAETDPDAQVLRVLSNLPQDTLPETLTRAQTLRRVLEMHPYRDEAEPKWDPVLRDQIKSIRKELLQKNN